MKKLRRRLREEMTIIYGDNMALHEKKCVPCEGGIPPMGKSEIVEFLNEINDNWIVINNHHLEREWQFDDFKTALRFVNITGQICEEEGHHANYELSWGYVKIIIWTHKIDGLTSSDFVLAAKFDQVE